METISEFDKGGRKSPYTTPDGFFDELEENIWKEVKDGYVKPRRPSALQVFLGSAIAVAASVALVFFVNMKAPRHDAYTVSDVDQAFSQLSADDQAFMLSVYQNDMFINE